MFSRNLSAFLRYTIDETKHFVIDPAGAGFCMHIMQIMRQVYEKSRRYKTRNTKNVRCWRKN